MTPTPKQSERAVIGSEKYRICHALVQLIYLSKGRKEFAHEDFSEEAFGYLAKLEAEGVLEQIPSGQPETRIYQLSSKEMKP